VSAVAAALLYAASNPGVVGLIDSGELMAVVMSGGVAHPTGYPLFTLLGYALAPWAGESPPALLAWLSHGPAALTVGLLCGVVARTMLRAGHGALHAALSAALVAAALGSSRSFWLAAGEIEVYTLTALLSAVLLALAWEGLGTSANRTRRRLFLLWCLIFGLAAGNHLSVLATAPAGLWLLSALPRRTRFTDTARGTAWALLGATVVLQLPLRAGAAPLLNWGDPSTSAAFLRHLRGAQYQVWMFTRGPAELATAAADLIRIELVEDIPALVAVVALGLILTRRLPRRGAMLLAVAAANLLLTLNYEIPDIRSYLIPGEVALALLAGAALAGLGRRGWIAAQSAALVLVVVAGVVSAPVAARADYRVVDDYARTLLEGLEPRAVLLTDRWDAYSSAIYLQQVEGLREDVALVDKELLRRSWYYGYLERVAPDLHAAVRTDVREFLDALRAFEAGEAYDAARLQRHYVAICRGLLAGGTRARPGYALLDSPEEILRGWRSMPRVLAWRMVPPGRAAPDLPALAPAALDPPRIPPSGSVLHDPRALRLADEHGRFAHARALLHRSQGRLDQALAELIRAARMLPADPACRRDLATLYQALGRPDDAQRALRQARRLAAAGAG